MKVIKQGNRRLFEEDRDTTAVVSEILADIRKNGMDAVRRYSKKLDDWNPASFELGDREIEEAIKKVPAQVLEAANKAVPGGEIAEVEKEVEDGQVIYDVEKVVDGVEYEIEVTADGVVKEVETDDEEDDD